MTRPALIALAALLLITSACGEEETMRRVELALDLSLPSGGTEMHETELHVATSGLETLQSGAGYLVWLESEGAAPVALGALDADGALVVALPDGTTEGEIVVTEEGDVDPLPTTPSDAHRLEGSLGGELAFNPEFVSAISESHGEVVLINNQAEATLEALPEAPPGLYYAVWAVWGEGAQVASDGHDDDAHQHKSAYTRQSDAQADDDHMDDDHMDDDHMDDDHMDDDHHADDAGHHLSHLGVLDSDGHMETNHTEMLATCQRVMVTLESHHGLTEVSSTVVLSGDVAVPGRTEGGHGGHMH